MGNPRAPRQVSDSQVGVLCEHPGRGAALVVLGEIWATLEVFRGSLLFLDSEG